MGTREHMASTSTAGRLRRSHPDCASSQMSSLREVSTFTSVNPSRRSEGPKAHAKGQGAGTPCPRAPSLLRRLAFCDTPARETSTRAACPSLSRPSFAGWNGGPSSELRLPAEVQCSPQTQL